MKKIAFYLPQYYTFPENDEWWGKGFTEWTNVKRAKPLYNGHIQPTVPQHNNYYTLEDINVMSWQANLAREAGISGFCFYHYWFRKDKLLMEKPVEQYLATTEIEFPFCFCWANHNWARTWTGGDKDILMAVEYGYKEDWKAHFDYLLPFFKDHRYIKSNNSPVFVLYMPQEIPNLTEMLDYWDELAEENGLGKILYISQHHSYIYKGIKERHIRYSMQYEPDFTKEGFALEKGFSKWAKAFKSSPRFVISMLEFRARKVLSKLCGNRLKSLSWLKYDYDGIWQMILNRKAQENRIPCAFVNYDTTPRKGYRGSIVKGYSPEKFENYLSRLIEKTEKEYKSEFLFIMAWNEWGEGAYLEPDEHFGNANLMAIKKALQGGNK